MAGPPRCQMILKTTDAEAAHALVRAALGSDEFSGAVVSMIPLTVMMNTLPKSDKWPDDIEKSFLKDMAAAAKEPGKPVVFVVGSGALYEPYCAHAERLGLPVFRSADRAVKMYRRYLEYVL